MSKRLVLLSQGVPANNSIEIFYKKAFTALGYNVIVLPVTRQKLFASSARRALKRLSRISYRGLSPDLNPAETLNEIRQFQPEFIIVFRCERLTGDFVATLRGLATHGCFNIYTDSPFVIPGAGAVQMFSPISEYDAIFTFSRALVPVFFQLGAKRVEWLPFGWDRNVHHPSASENNVAFECAYFGSWGPIQEQWLTVLSDFNLAIFGNGWYHLPKKSPLFRSWRQGEGIGVRMAKEIARSQVVFNLIRAEHGCAHSMKTFEIPACGGFMLSNRTEEQSLFFRDGHDAVFFDTFEEMKDKCAFYLSHPTLRTDIIKNALSRIKENDYFSRARSIVDYAERGTMKLSGLL